MATMAAGAPPSAAIVIVVAELAVAATMSVLMFTHFLVSY
jgi:hypothetical protein